MRVAAFLLLLAPAQAFVLPAPVARSQNTIMAASRDEVSCRVRAVIRAAATVRGGPDGDVAPYVLA